MSDSLREALCALVARHGTKVCIQSEWCRSLLLDRHTHDRRALENLMDGIRAGIPVELLARAEPEFPDDLLQSLVRRLREDRTLSEEEAREVVSTWAAAVRDLPRPDYLGASGPAPTKETPTQKFFFGLGLGGTTGLLGGGVAGALVGSLFGAAVGGLFGMCGCCTWGSAALPGAMLGGTLGLRLGSACAAAGGLSGGLVGGPTGRVSDTTWAGCVAGAVGGGLGGWLVTAVAGDVLAELPPLPAPPGAPPGTAHPGLAGMQMLIPALGTFFGAVGGFLGGLWGSRLGRPRRRRVRQEDDE